MAALTGDQGVWVFGCTRAGSATGPVNMSAADMPPQMGRLPGALVSSTRKRWSGTFADSSAGSGRYALTSAKCQADVEV